MSTIHSYYCYPRYDKLSDQSSFEESVYSLNDTISFLNELDIKHIVLETDAPYLAPTPFRGKRNESSYVMNVLKKVAEICKEFVAK